LKIDKKLNAIAIAKMKHIYNRKEYEKIQVLGDFKDYSKNFYKKLSKLKPKKKKEDY
jgi:hypothetical protein